MIPRTSTRPPALAGAWYPADPETLHRTVAAFLAPARQVAELSRLSSLIVPHAGHIYSGAIAGLAWGALALALQAGRAHYRRVVLLGPAHRVGFHGIALGDFTAFFHPLGVTEVDRTALVDLEEQGLGTFVSGAHDAEHCIEIQLPFVHAVLPQRPIVPLLIGHGPEAELTRMVDAALDRVLGPDDLLVVSSDLSHFRPYDEARRLDQDTLAHIIALDERLDGDRACGYQGIHAAIRRARKASEKAVLLDYRNSGDTAGDKRSVVGYGALALGPVAA